MNFKMSLNYILKPALVFDAEEIANMYLPVFFLCLFESQLIKMSMHLSRSLLPRTALEYAAVSDAEYLAWSAAGLRSINATLSLRICAR